MNTIRNYKKLLLLAVVLLTGTALRLVAQDKGKTASPENHARMIALLEKVQKAYQEAAYLRFRVKYLYANDGGNNNAVDSLTGEIEMDKDRCHFVIAGMETMRTDKYIIQVMPEEKAIYLSAARPQAANNPIAIVDSLLSNLKVLQGDIRQLDGIDLVTLYFPPGQAYSSMQMQIDDRTDFFRGVRYSLHTATLVSQDQIARPSHPGPYQPEGHVDITFTDYEKGKFNETVFDERNFFYKTAGQFVPAPRYKDYHIYLASSKL